MIGKFGLSTGLYLLLVFLSGSLVGGFAHRLYMMNSVSANSTQRSPEEWRRQYVEEMKTRLKLNDEQVAGLHQVLDESRSRFDEVRKKSRPEIKAIQEEQVRKIRSLLNESQQAEYEKLREERQKRRRSHKSSC